MRRILVCARESRRGLKPEGAGRHQLGVRGRRRGRGRKRRRRTAARARWTTPRGVWKGLDLTRRSSREKIPSNLRIRLRMMLWSDGARAGFDHEVDQVPARGVVCPDWA